MSSSLAVERLAEIVPLHLLRKLVVKFRATWRGSLEEVHQRVAPFVRAPQRLQVEQWNVGK